jgi:hypothetical protein
MTMMAERLKSIPGLSERYQMLSKDQASGQIRIMRLLLRVLDSSRSNEVRHFDATGALPSEIGDWLVAQEIENEQVAVYWLYDNAAALMMMHDFIKYFDDLWYPSSDDVVVLPMSNQYVLYVDHEEHVYLYILNPGT